MINLNDFGEYYKTISNTELLIILENPDDYQPIAVEAAKKEFTNRQLSDIEITEAKQPFLIKKLREDKQKEKIKSIEAKVKNTGTTIIDTLNPIQEGVTSTEKIIRFIVIVFSGIFLYQLITGFGMIRAYVKDIPQFPFESSLFLFPFIIIPIAIIIFWKRKTMGWILLTIFLTFSVVAALWGLFFSITWKPSGSGFDSLFPKPSPFTYIVQLIFLGGTQYVICKQKIREIFNINEEKMLMAIGVTGVVTFFLIYGVS